MDKLHNQLLDDLSKLSKAGDKLAVASARVVRPDLPFGR